MGARDRRVGGQRDHLLGDPAGRVGRDLRPPLGHLGRRRIGTDQHADPAVPVHRLGHQFTDPVQHDPGLGLVTGSVGRHRLQAGVLVQVVGDQLRDVAVHGLVVGHAVAWGIGQEHPVGLGHGEDLPADLAALGVGEIDQLDIEPEIQGVDPRAGIPIANLPVRHGEIVGRGQQQVAALGQQLVLEPRGRVRTAGQQGHHTVRRAVAEQGVPKQRQRTDGVQQPVRAGQVGQHLVHQVPDRDRVRRAAGVADVVLQHPPAAELVADQIEAHHRGPHGARRQPGGLGAPAGRTFQQFPGEHPVADDLLLAVHVAEEHLDRPRALNQALRQRLPLVRADQSRHQVDREPLLLAPDPERHVGSVDPVHSGLLAVVQIVVAEAAEIVDQLVVDRPWSMAGTDGLVPGSVPVPAQRGHRRFGSAGRSVSLLHDQFHHVAQSAPLGVRGPLPVRRVASGQGHLGQLADLRPVAQLLELRAQPLDQGLHRVSGRHRLGVPGVVQQHAGQTAPGGLPDRRAVHRRGHRRESAPALDVLLGGEHGGPEQARDQHGVVDDRAGVAGAQLQGRGVRGRSYVEVGHLGVRDDPGVDQVGEHLVVGARRPQPAGRAGARPALPDDRADAGVSGVLLVPERRAGRQGEQDGQVAGDPLHDLHREVPVAHPDVDLQAADQLLVDQHPVLLLHPSVAAGGGQLEVGEGRARRRAGGGDPDLVLGRDLDQALAQSGQL